MEERKPPPHSQHCKKPGKFGIAWFNCVFLKKKEKKGDKEKKKTSKKPEIQKKVMISASGLGGRTQKKKWGSK